MKHFYLVGRNIDYSLSGVIYEYLFKIYKIKAKYEILNTENLFDVQEKLLLSSGFNITIPFKEKILSQLEIECSKTIFNVINTVKVKDNKLFGYNTDFSGIEKFFQNHQKEFKDMTTVGIFGTGGTAKTLEYYFKTKRIKVIKFSRKTRDVNANIYLYSELEKFNFDMLINATPLGQGKYKGISPIEEDTVSNLGVKYVIDFNYAPYNNKFLLLAKKNDIKTYTGLDFLINQAMYNFQIWANIDLTSIYEKKIQIEVEKYLLNGLVIYGMPLAGKTTLYNDLEKVRKSKRIKIFDLDSIITKEVGNLNSLINNKIDSFREMEYQKLKEIITNNKETFNVIFLGGGTLENNHIISLLEGYKLIYLNVNFLELQKRLNKEEMKKRPLIKTKEDLILLVEKRKFRYNQIYDDQFLSQESLKEYLYEMYDN